MEDFNDCDGGPRAPIPYKLFDDLIAENRKLKTFIRDDYTQAPNDYGDDISTDLAIKLSEAQGELARLRTALRGLVDEINTFKIAYESESDAPLVVNDYMERIFAKAAAAEAEGEGK